MCLKTPKRETIDSRKSKMHRFFKRSRREIADNMDMAMEGYMKRETEFRSTE